MHPFSIPWKHQKTENLTVFCCFQGIEKGYIENKWVNLNESQQFLWFNLDASKKLMSLFSGSEKITWFQQQQKNNKNKNEKIQK